MSEFKWWSFTVRGLYSFLFHGLKEFKLFYIKLYLFKWNMSSIFDSFQWTHNRGVSGVGMFSDLPLTFQAELSLMINKKVLEKVHD